MKKDLQEKLSNCLSKGRKIIAIEGVYSMVETLQKRDF